VTEQSPQGIHVLEKNVLERKAEIEAEISEDERRIRHLNAEITRLERKKELLNADFAPDERSEA
jgi:hypothetical protein